MVLFTSKITIEKLQLPNRKMLPIVKFTISHEPGVCLIIDLNERSLSTNFQGTTYLLYGPLPIAKLLPPGCRT